ncbi:MAG: hypothetical protein JNM17_30270 [Archangium sp.]|nr:hypothetical protein [Archangium sp.]
MRRSLLLGVMLSSALAGAQDFVRVVQSTPFSTTAPVFVRMPNTDLTFSAGTNELMLLLWKARLSNSEGGNASAEIFITPDGGSRWGLGSSSGRGPNETQLWSNFDWDGARSLTLFAMVRAVDGGTAIVEDFEAVAINLGSPGQLQFQENLSSVTVNDAQWSVLASRTIPAMAPTTEWLVFAQATVERTHASGVSLRLRVGANEFPVLNPVTDPRTRFLASGAAPRMFFYAAPLTLNPMDVVDFEGMVNPRGAGAPNGASGDLRDVRLLLIPSTVLEKRAEAISPGGFGAVLGAQAIAAQLPRTDLDGGWELLTLSALITSDGGTMEHQLITEPGSPPFVQRDVVNVTSGVENSMISTWVLRPTNAPTQVLPQWWVRSLSGGIQGWAGRSARWRIDGGAAVPVIDAGTPDAGPSDAGFDAGEEDAGFDGGTPDAGLDAGAMEDDDAGVGKRRLGVGCSCDSSAGLGLIWLVALITSRRRIVVLGGPHA